MLIIQKGCVNTTASADRKRGRDMEKKEIKNFEKIAESLKKNLNLSPKDHEEDKVRGKRFTKDDINFILTMLALTFLFSVRGGEFPGAILATFQQVFVSVFYGFGTVFLIIGVTKKMFKYDPTRVQIVRWAMGLALFFAVSQFMHEGFLLYTGQMPHKP